MASLAVVLLFLIDADAPLQNGDPDDHRRIVALLHSKWALAPLTAAVMKLCAAIVGPSGFLESLALQLVIHIVNPVARIVVLRVWPGPPPAEAEQHRLLAQRAELHRLRAQLADQRRLRAQRARLMEECRRLMLETDGLSWASDGERKGQILQRLQQILHELSPDLAADRAAPAADSAADAGHRVAAAAEGEELPA